jgi:uracil-DNA glycosylase
VSAGSADSLESIAKEVSSCTKCPLHLSRTRAVPGEGPANATVMLVGEGPGYNEDQKGLPFVGAAGQNLESLLSKANITRELIFITNIVKCRPPGNRRPTGAEADACHPYIRRQIELVGPRVVVLLGDTALKQFFPTSSLGGVHGKAVTRDGRTFFPTYHPAAMIYNRSLKAVLEGDFERLGELLRTFGA